MGLIKRIIKQEALGVKNKFKKEPERIDIDLPFDFFIGCEIKVGLADFMLMENEALINSLDSVFLVRGFSKFELQGMTVFRFYLNNNNFLEVFLDEKTKDCINTRLYAEFSPDLLEDGGMYPIYPADWEEWIGVQGHLRMPEFWTPELAQGGQAQFLRVWDQGHRLADLAWWSETIITDPYGEGAMTFDIGAQLFAREIKTIAIGSSTGQDAETVLEYLLAQTEEDEEGARIALYLGSNVNPAAIELV